MPAVTCQGMIRRMASPGLDGGFGNVQSLDQEALMHPTRVHEYHLSFHSALNHSLGILSRAFINVATMIPIILIGGQL